MRIETTAGLLDASDNAFSALESQLQMLALKRTYGAAIAGTNGAGNVAVCEVKNPSGSGKTLYFIGGSAFVSAASATIVVVDGTSLAPAGTPTPLYAGGGASVATVGGGNQLAPTGTAFIKTGSLSGNSIFLLPVGFWFALPPNHNLQVQSSAVAVTNGANLTWVELST